MSQPLIIVEHRINTVDKLLDVPLEHGVEIDIRHRRRFDDRLELYLNHEPTGEGESFEHYLAEFGSRPLVVLNVKDDGLNQRVIDLCDLYGIGPKRRFELDVSAPYLYFASRDPDRRRREIAVRYSEFEPIEGVLAHEGYLDWVWIDCVTTLPLSSDVVRQLAGMKICLVCPSRWGRPQDIEPYADQIANLELPLTAVMTDRDLAERWHRALGR